MQVSRKLLGISLVLALTLALVAQVALASPASPSKGTARIVQAQATGTETPGVTESATAVTTDTTTPGTTDTTTPGAVDTTTPAATETLAATSAAPTVSETVTVAATAVATGTSTAPTTLPVTGGGDGQSNWLIPLLLVGGVLLLLGAYVRRSAR